MLLLEDLRMPWARFGLKGDLIRSEEDVNEVESRYLHHHGDEPERPG